jgi:hypothetical protein
LFQIHTALLAVPGCSAKRVLTLAFGRAFATYIYKETHPVKNRVLISNLPESATSEALLALFTELGYEIEDIDLGPNPNWRLPPGYAVVTLSPKADLREAIGRVDGHDFQGRSILVSGVRPLKWRYRSERVA